MHLLSEISTEGKSILDGFHKIQKELRASIQLAPQLQKLSSDEDLRKYCEEKKVLAVLKRGSFKASQNKQIFYILEEGDVFCPVLHLNFPGVTLVMDLACEFEIFPWEAVWSQALASPESLDLWLKAQSHFSAIWANCLSSVLHHGAEANTEIRDCPAGQNIIEQGTRADEVYFMIEGEADVVVNGITVGKVKKDEIFGSLAALTGAPRTASVVAKEQCLVMMTKSVDFLTLVKTRPMTVTTLVQDMARIIGDLNLRVVDLSQKRAGL
ncbi:MAG: hypothetical protein COV44_06660 [Deltaproteobacteria bacterium CG11_big_fil_rev_8_21_14_0_20_45_16]|nr:MAG: hypothetical protein COV44_06660 [Deltaproteobacteria bacterium CG11_big_fil_rev_8_21_14_0_20_45_16]